MAPPIAHAKTGVRPAFKWPTALSLVKQAHNQLRRLVALGYSPVVIGKPGHVEVEGLIGDFPGTWVIEKPEDIERLPQSDRYGVIFANDAAAREGARADRSDPQGAARRGGALQRYRLPATKNRQNALRKLIANAIRWSWWAGRNSNNTASSWPQRP